MIFGIGSFFDLISLIADLLMKNGTSWKAIIINIFHIGVPNITNKCEIPVL